MENKPKKNVSLIAIAVENSEFVIDVMQRLEETLHGADYVKINDGVYLIDSDDGISTISNLFNEAAHQNKAFGKEVVQVIVLDSADFVATLLASREGVKQWMQARDIRVRSLSSPLPGKPSSPKP